MRLAALALLCPALALADQGVWTSSTGVGAAAQVSTSGVAAQGALATRSRYGLTEALALDGGVRFAFGDANPNFLLSAGIGWEHRFSNHFRFDLTVGLPLEIPLHSGLPLLGGLYADVGGRFTLVWGTGLSFDVQSTYLRASLSSPDRTEVLAVVGIYQDFDVP